MNARRPQHDAQITVAARRRDVIAILFASLFPLLMAWIDSDFFADRANSIRQYSYPIGVLVQLGFPLLYNWLSPLCVAPSNQSLGFRRSLLFSILFAAFAVAVAGSCYAVLRDKPYSPDSPVRIATHLARFHADTPGRYLVFGAWIVVLHSGLEEYYWRWFLFGRLRQHLAMWPAAFLSGFAFMAYHVPVLFDDFAVPIALPLVVAVGIGGVTFAALYEKTGRIGYVWLSHGLVDIGVLAIGWDLVHNSWPS